MAGADDPFGWRSGESDLPAGIFRVPEEAEDDPRSPFDMLPPPVVLGDFDLRADWRDAVFQPQPVVSGWQPPAFFPAPPHPTCDEGAGIGSGCGCEVPQVLRILAPADGPVREPEPVFLEAFHRRSVLSIAANRSILIDGANWAIRVADPETPEKTATSLSFEGRYDLPEDSPTAADPDDPAFDATPWDFPPSIAFQGQAIEAPAADARAAAAAGGQGRGAQRRAGEAWLQRRGVCFASRWRHVFHWNGFAERSVDGDPTFELTATPLHRRPAEGGIGVRLLGDPGQAARWQSAGGLTIVSGRQFGQRPEPPDVHFRRLGLRLGVAEPGDDAREPVGADTAQAVLRFEVKDAPVETPDPDFSAAPLAMLVWSTGDVELQNTEELPDLDARGGIVLHRWDGAGRPRSLTLGVDTQGRIRTESGPARG